MTTTDDGQHHAVSRPDHVVVNGRRRLELPADPGELDRFSVTLETFEYTCHTGRPIGGRWLCVALGDVLEAADLPPATTHVLVEGADEYRICLDIHTALESHLGLRRIGGAEDTPRLHAPSIPSERTVRSVVRIDPIAIDAGTDPREFETIG